jgi:hypothetical protein
MAAILARRAKNRPVKLLYDESNFYCNGDDAATYRCKVGAKKDGTITACDWHVVGPFGELHIDKTHESTGIPNLRNTQEWALRIPEPPFQRSLQEPYTTLQANGLWTIH